MPSKSEAEKEVQRIREAAFRLLAIRAHSAGELKTRLTQKKFPAEQIELVIADLQEKGYQSDEEFARLFTREKWTSSGWGPGRVRQALAQKGVAPPVCDQILEEVYGDVDLIEGLLPLARKRWRTTDGLDNNTRRRRLAGFLQRRGYNWDTIQRVITKISENHSETSA
jgi:SOS response regulatory protein OraA/RecX